MMQTPPDLNDYQRAILELTQLIGDLPTVYALPINQKVREVVGLVAVLHKSILDQLNDLQIAVSYIQFDLEATRRERDELKSRLG